MGSREARGVCLAAAKGEGEEAAVSKPLRGHFTHPLPPRRAPCPPTPASLTTGEVWSDLLYSLHQELGKASHLTSSFLTAAGRVAQWWSRRGQLLDSDLDQIQQQAAECSFAC